ncbi:dual specificity phosphatase [Dactylonectria estremocensis]|uniref:protein-tyrosine-phosphatase n=1 Tax=Dactylonectria estremocensis TaxID=1079267 RepID=A0A9P9FH04_9HYPO|nr:dual specificity phosphatase [Dactylonectria estremocensis]
MPSATDRRAYEDQIPSFMTVFGLDAETMADQETVTIVDPKFVGMESKAPGYGNPSQQHPFRAAMIPTDPTHKHHDSTSTQTSESADSSPTTTLSTTDSASLSDPSPSSSPDSPVNLIPLSSFPATTFGNLSNSATNTNSLGLPGPPRMQRPMTSPSPRRARNMKGLSIQPPFAASTTTTVSLVSEPSSPVFIKPMIPAMKRKPSQLSLKTNTSDFIAKTTLEVPSSPAMAPMLQRRALKHSTSSPHMLSGLKSTTFGPAGGMTFPKVLERNESGLSEVLRPMKSSMKMSFDTTITEEDSPIKTQLANRSELEPFQENENNEDLKTPGYPDGPIAIYGDNVFLYLEPTAKEASRFDVVINVAREVNNPFEIRKAVQENQARSGQFRQPTPEAESPIPDTAVEECSVETPTTPKALSFKDPEYIHIPWDHNTDIAPDLLNLCETIENRTKEGKKVLVHCQQGASRSASLIIAYGLYQKPEMTVNDAYYAAQAKSRWISPNMKLMYSLQDFQKEVSTKRSSPPSFRPRTGRSPTKHRLTLSANAIEISPKEPKTAPLPEKDDRSKEARPRQSPNRLRGNSTPGPRPVSPGPASAPPTYTWAEEIEQKTEERLNPFKLGELPARPKSGHGKPHTTQGFPPAPIHAPNTAPALNLAPAPSLDSYLSLGPAPRLAPAPSLGSSLSLGPAPALDSWSKPPPSPGFSSPANFGFQTLSYPRFSEQSAGKLKLFDDQPVERTISIPGGFPEEDEALMSPRVETMTKNPLHAFPDPPSMRFVECPPTPGEGGEGLFSPRAGMFPRDPFSSFGGPQPVSDPRSPPTLGEAPIVRSIDDLI